jgi:hypothetical protein
VAEFADWNSEREGRGLPRYEPSLKSGDGNGTSDDMEARVKRLEDDSKEMRADLKAIRVDLAEIKGRMSAMPTTWQMVGLIVAMAVAIFTVVRVALPL